ncbi:MAG TPA: nuclear transport factor 2 family protein [Usitatibacter sp.]|nr:nuclear transport factor 2 family protein [Usitatibacter sp.]
MPTRRARLFPTPDDAETAFYEAFERGDLPAMMAVWAESDDVVCVHPRGPRLVGFEAVRDSWMQIFSGGRSQVRVRATELRRFDGNEVSVHALVEVLTAAGQPQPAQSVCATNVYELTDGGWRMVIHHATPVAEPEPAPDSAPTTPHTLH